MPRSALSKPLPVTKTAMANASLLCAIEAARHHLGTAQRVATPYGGDVVPLWVQMKPKKGVLATAPITVVEPLVLLPETTSLTLVDRGQPCFLKAGIEVGGQLLALNSVFIDPYLSAKGGKVGVVAFFWRVRRSGVEADCNMKIVDSTVITGTDVSWAVGKLSTKSIGDAVVPMMVSTRIISQGTERVCYYKENAMKLERKRVA